MKFQFILDNVIKPKLVDMLGRKMTEDLFREAQFSSANANDDSERLRQFVDVTCSDSRFIGMWGTAQAEKQKKEWLNLLT